MDDKSYESGYYDGINDLRGIIYKWITEKHPELENEYMEVVKNVDK
jgi:hypothetical protein